MLFMLVIKGLLNTIFSSHWPVEQPCMVKHIKYINSTVSPLLTSSHNNAIFSPFYLNQSLARPSTCSERDKNKGVPRDKTITWLGLMSPTRESWGNKTPGDVIIPRGSSCGKQISNVSVISAIWVFNTTELLIPKDQHPLAGPASCVLNISYYQQRL